MSARKLQDWLEIGGLFGVFAGLIFVGLQLYFDRQLAAVASVDTAMSSQQYWAEIINANADVWVRGLAGETLSPAEEARFSELAAAREMRYFSDFSRSLRGVSNQPPERWITELAVEIHANPGFLGWWRDDRNRFATVRDRIAMPDTRWGAAVTAEIERLDAEGSER